MTTVTGIDPVASRNKARTLDEVRSEVVGPEAITDMSKISEKASHPFEVPSYQDRKESHPRPFFTR